MTEPAAPIGNLILDQLLVIRVELVELRDSLSALKQEIRELRLEIPKPLG